jgi:hypothetical protein
MNLCPAYSDQLFKLFENLRETSRTQPSIISPAELTAAGAAPNGATTPQRLAVLAPALLRLAGKAAVLLVVSVLAGLLMPGDEDADRDRLLRDPGETRLGDGLVTWLGDT